MTESHSGLPRILVVDDVPENIEVLRGILRPDYQVLAALNGRRALEIAARDPQPDLILLDVMMPGLDGYEVCRRLKASPACAGIPVIFVTARDNDADQERGFAVGAVDYVTKPVKAPIILSRIRAHIALHRTSQDLAAEVRERTRQLSQATRRIIQNLAQAAEFRDNETGLHVVRMSHYARCLALALGLGADWCETLFNAAPMHDVGKIGIPDYILHKPGKLNADEWAIMQTHAALGASIIGAADGSELLEMAASVARSHHERWDGSGYPAGLAGVAIPLEGRIVAVVDVFDALTAERPYKPAWTVEAALDLIALEAGRHFDPAIAARFLEIVPEIQVIRARFVG